MKPLLPIVAMLCLFASLQAQTTPTDNRYPAQEQVSEPEHEEYYAPMREDFSFKTTFLTDDEGYINRIFVQEFATGDESPYLEREYELVNRLEEAPSDDEITHWVDDKTDINFDGVPDLMIYLGCNAAGHVSEYFAGLVWNVEYQYFEEIKGFDSIDSPIIDPATKTITSTVRSGAAEITTRTYCWEGYNLKLIKEEISDL